MYNNRTMFFRIHSYSTLAMAATMLSAVSSLSPFSQISAGGDGNLQSLHLSVK